MSLRMYFMISFGSISVFELGYFAMRKKGEILKRQQKKVSGKRKGSQNRKKQIVRMQKIYQQIRDMRTDFNHKVSTAIAKHYGTVVMEGLSIQDMVRNHHLAKGISDQGWHQLMAMLEDKLGWRDADLIMISRFEPST